MAQSLNSYVLETTLVEGRFSSKSLGTLVALAERCFGFIRSRYQDGQHLLYQCEPGQSLEQGQLVARISRVQ